ncbi:FAD-dependent oxidoreductase [Mesorhizobium loti]|uniref:FAD-dependent oxidoreductase n=1 Tax=Mesorhizobium TaxID=68287 RepID=UPI00319E8037
MFPDVDTSAVISWAGCALPNMVPRIGVGRSPGIFYNTGHGHLGWTLSAAAAQIIAEEISEQLPK